MNDEHIREDDPPVIWLAPGCETGDRTWCSDRDVYETCEDCGAGPVAYVRWDLVRDHLPDDFDSRAAGSSRARPQSFE